MQNRVLGIEDVGDFLEGIQGSLFDSSENKQKPLLPSRPLAHPSQVGVVLFFFPQNVLAEVKYRQIQQPALHYVVDVENPACTSIAIPKRVNRFKLKVGNRDFYQRIDLWVLGVIDKLNQAPRQFLQNSLTSGRRIDRLSGIG